MKLFGRFHITRAQLAWALYDWGNSVFATSVIAGFFPIFFKELWSQGANSVDTTTRLALANSAIGLTLALFAPILGAISDSAGHKKKFQAVFVLTGIAASGALAALVPGEWKLAITFFVIASVGFSGANIFYDALLTDVSTAKEYSFVSAFGYSMGYIGGGLLFALHVAMLVAPGAFGFSSSQEVIPYVFYSVSLWWALFSLPLFLWVKEKKETSGHTRKLAASIRHGLLQLAGTVKEARHLKQIVLFLFAYWLYIDGVDTVVRMAVDYGLSIGFHRNDLITALLIVQFIGFPFALLGGVLAKKFSEKKTILIGIGIYIIITIWAVLMTQRWEFYCIAALIATSMGSIQALSRSLYARLIPAERAAQYFGIYNMLGKFAVVIGPLFIAFAGEMIQKFGGAEDEAARGGIASLLLLFFGGAWLLLKVNEKKGKEEAAWLQKHI